MLASGLIAGLTYSEMRTLQPGIICTLFIYRRLYDDAQHGIRRNEQVKYDPEEG